MSLLLPMVIVILVATGMGIALLGSIKVTLAARLKIDEARMGGLVSTFGFTLIPVILTAGIASDLAGRQPVAIGGAVLFTASLALFAQARGYGTVLAAVLLLSAGWGTLINVVNPLQITAFGGSPAYAINLGCFIFGIGSFVTPLGVAFLVRKIGLRGSMFLLSASGVAMAVLAAAASFPPLPAPSATPAAAPGLGTLLGDRIMWLCALALFFYMPAEATMAAWATTYVTDKGMKEGAASALLSGFWLAYTAARLVAALAIPKGSEATMVLVLSLASLAVWAGIVLCRGKGPAATLVIALAVVFGPIYPTVLAILLGHFPAPLHGRAIGLFFTLGGLGCTAIPMLIGAYARKTSVQRGFLLAAASAAGLCAVALVLAVKS